MIHQDPQTTALARLPGLVDSISEIFEPVEGAGLEELLLEHARRKSTIEETVGFFRSPEVKECLRYFVRGSEVTDSYGVERMFTDDRMEHALRALDADFWGQALELTDVLSVMPACRRDEWREQIHNLKVPPFTEDALRATLAEHLKSRHLYFAERVDGLFRALSPNHKTNIAAGFRSKMILAGVTDGWWSSSSRMDALVDLRVVVGKFMGREDARGDLHVLTRKLVEKAQAYNRGEWVLVDGGAIEIRVYQNGNCHIRVHEEIAWRLNAVLASKNPGAIPESNRTRPAYTGKKTRKKVTRELFTRPLPFPVLRVLSEFRQYGRESAWEYGYTWEQLDRHVRAEVGLVLGGLGGVKDDERLASMNGRWRFDYDVSDALREVLASGTVPDQRAHQYYPTPEALARRVVELADVSDGDRVLEPSAGQGAIADLLPGDRLKCVEASKLHCAVLRGKGHDVDEGDFLEWKPEPGKNPTRVVMNPPFDRRQWVDHVEYAARVLSREPGSRIVAILPEGAPRRFELPGFTLSWSPPVAGAFAGTSVSVVVLVATVA